MGYAYDAAGNMTGDGLHGYTYNAEGQISAVDASVTYTYDANGNRVRKDTAPGGFTEYLYWGGQPIAEKNQAGGWTDYVFFGGRRIARRDAATGAAHYYLSDHLGSSNVVAGATGAIEEESDFYPFGGERVIADTLPDQHYKFTGKERDSESGLDYFGARYYGSSMGRFLSPDEFAGGPVSAFGGDPTPPGPLPYANITNPQSLNKYAYAWNNPLRYVDPDGHQTQELSKQQVEEAIKKAQASSLSVAATAVRLFNELPANASVKGETVTAALKDTGVKLDATGNALLSNANTITKSGDTVNIQNNNSSKTDVNGTKLEIGKNVSFKVGVENGSPTVSNISGVKADVGVTVDVKKIQIVTDSQGKAAAKVTGSKFGMSKTVTIPLE